MTEDERTKLRRAAIDASAASYSPYSHFRVGAAVRADSGQIYAGCNVENASYGLTICAERNAIFHAVAAGEKRITDLVLYTPTPTPSTPCGACRQVLVEFGGDAHVECTSDGDGTLQFSAAELLPKSFAL